MPAALAVPAAISAGTSIFGGLLGSSASKRAAAQQAAASERAQTGLNTTLDYWNPRIGEAGTAAANDVNAAAAAGVSGITGQVGQGQSAINEATTGGQGRVDAATAQALELLKPYIGAGGDALTTLRGLMGAGGDLNKTFTAEDMRAYDPGYQFRLDQANKAIQASAAARGGSLGGAALRSLANTSQNLASSEYGNAEQRFRAQQTDRFNRLNTLVNLGASTANQAGNYGMTGADLASRLGLTGAQSAADLGLRGYTSAADLGLRGATTAGGFTTGAVGQQAQNALNTQGAIANLITGTGNAQAAGTIGSANAWAGMLGGLGQVGQQAGRYFQDQDLLMNFMQNPAQQSGFGPYGGTQYRWLPKS
jgi:hypothetical protein